MLVERKQSCPLICIISETDEEETPSFQILKIVFPVYQVCSFPIKTGLFSLLLHNSFDLRGQARSFRLEDPEEGGMAAGSEPKLPPLALRVG